MKKFVKMLVWFRAAQNRRKKHLRGVRIPQERIGAVSVKTFHELEIECGVVFKYRGDLFTPGFLLVVVEGACFQVHS